MDGGDVLGEKIRQGIDACDEAVVLVSPDEAIDRRVRDSLSKSHEVFVLLTEHSLNNSWIVPTLGAAFGLHKPITAVLMGVREHEIPLMVQGMRRLKYADVDDYIAALQSRSERVFA